ncbi:hypothetical protein [Actinomadura sp. DC4]|uniref:hypothetical protein n=1 Tax=Actinomadura sp. DC4 TaxID=3055069 RepID=UPI0025AF8532|nr:hypothetical protein [Actinomadura sp. DC4]MDN3357699.1 hypothetical protein [Actinomadura sp. DC4]
MNRTVTWMTLVRIAVAVYLVAVFGLAVPANADTSTACSLESLDLPPGKVHSGAAVHGTVRLGCPASQDTEVELASADAGWVSVPQQVVVPAGRSEADVPIQTHQPDFLSGDFSVALTASLGDRQVGRSLELQPGLKYLVVNSPVTSGDSVFVQIGLNGTAPDGGTVVTMESDDPAVRLPATIKIPSGASGVAGSYATTVRVPQDADVTITAELPDQVKTATVALKAWTYDAGAWSLTGPQTVHGGGFLYDMALDLPNPVPHGGVDVTFGADDPRIGLPSRTNLVEGTSGTKDFQFSVPYDIDGHATVDAHIEGVGTRSFTVRVLPGLKEIETPWQLYGGQSVEGTIDLGTVTSEPLTVRLSGDNPILHVPEEVTVPAGSSSVTFPVTIDPVDEFQVVTLTAELGGTYLSSDLFIDPAP